MALGPVQRRLGLVELLRLYLLTRAVADREHGIRRLGVILHQLVGQLVGDLRLAGLADATCAC